MYQRSLYKNRPQKNILTFQLFLAKLALINSNFMIFEEEVKHIAKLARLTLTEKEIKTFSTQLSDVLEYVELLNSVDAEGSLETSQVTGLQNVTEKDEIMRKCDGEALLLCSPLPKERKQIRVKPIIKM